VHRPGALTRFAPDDCPINLSEWQIGNCFQQGLDGEEQSGASSRDSSNRGTSSSAVCTVPTDVPSQTLGR
jgi:hypothetical protein